MGPRKGGDLLPNTQGVPQEALDPTTLSLSDSCQFEHRFLTHMTRMLLVLRPALQGQMKSQKGDAFSNFHQQL